MESPRQRRERLRLELATAAMRREWAIAVAERNGATPALTRFIEESREEYRHLAAQLEKLHPPAKPAKSFKASN